MSLHKLAEGIKVSDTRVSDSFCNVSVVERWFKKSFQIGKDYAKPELIFNEKLRKIIVKKKTSAKEEKEK